MNSKPALGITVDLIFEDDRWNAVGLPAAAQRACDVLAEKLALPPAGYEFALLATSDEHIRELNREHRDIDKATNVLSWPFEDLAPEIDGAKPYDPTDPTSAFTILELDLDEGMAGLLFETRTNKTFTVESDSTPGSPAGWTDGTSVSGDGFPVRVEEPAAGERKVFRIRVD